MLSPKHVSQRKLFHFPPLSNGAFPLQPSIYQKRTVVKSSRVRNASDRHHLLRLAQAKGKLDLHSSARETRPRRARSSLAHLSNRRRLRWEFVHHAAKRRSASGTQAPQVLGRHAGKAILDGRRHTHTLRRFQIKKIDKRKQYRLLFRPRLVKIRTSFR